MIRHQVQTSTLRLHMDDGATEMAPYDATCMLLWLSPTTVLVSGLLGSMPRKLMREFIHFCAEQKIETIKARREPGRRLPFGRVNEADGTIEISVFEALKRIHALEVI